MNLYLLPVQRVLLEYVIKLGEVKNFLKKQYNFHIFYIFRNMRLKKLTMIPIY